MTAVCQFDPGEGRLRMSAAGMAALPAISAGDLSTVDQPLLSELTSGGVMSGEMLHPRLVPLANAVSKPGVRVHLDRSLPSRPSSMDAWVDDRIVALFWRAGGAGGGDVVVVPRGMLPLRLARLVDLKPRPRTKVSDPIELDEALIETVLAPGEGLSASQLATLLGSDDEVIPEWLSVLSAVSTSPVVRWRVGAWWNSHEESPAARSLEIAESDGGCFLIVRHRRQERRYRRVALYPVTSSQIWRLLCALVPSPEEVSEPLAD